VPHVHFRLQGDLVARSQNDAVYIELEKREGVLPQDLTVASELRTDCGSPENLLKMDADAAHKPRTLVDKEQEMRWLAGSSKEAG